MWKVFSRDILPRKVWNFCVSAFDDETSGDDNDSNEGNIADIDEEDTNLTSTKMMVMVISKIMMMMTSKMMMMTNMVMTKNKMMMTNMMMMKRKTTELKYSGCHHHWEGESGKKQPLRSQPANIRSLSSSSSFCTCPLLHDQ